MKPSFGLVIGRSAKSVSVADALSHVFGYFVAEDDVLARDWQFHSPTFTMGKSFDTHGPIGPWIVTADEIRDPQALGLRCLVDGEVRQNCNTANMLHPIDAQISYLSTAFTLEPGDLIATGTPEGVGVGMDPAELPEERRRRPLRGRRDRRDREPGRLNARAAFGAKSGAAPKREDDIMAVLGMLSFHPRGAR